MGKLHVTLIMERSIHTPFSLEYEKPRVEESEEVSAFFFGSFWRECFISVV